MDRGRRSHGWDERDVDWEPATLQASQRPKRAASRNPRTDSDDDVPGTQRPAPFIACQVGG